MKGKGWVILMNKNRNLFQWGALIYKWSVCILLLSLSGAAFGEEYEFKHSLDEYIHYALEHNPMMHAAEKMIDMKRQEKVLTRTIPNPTVTGMFMPTSDDSLFGFGKVSVSQMIPWPGKLKKKRLAAESSISVMEMSKKDKEVMLVNKVRTAYVSLYTVGKKIEYTKMSLALLKQMESVMLSKYATAMGSQMALLKLQTKMAVVENMIINMEEMGEIIRFKMEALLNTPHARKFPYPDSLPRLVVPRDEDNVREIALISNPVVLLHQEKVKEAKSMVNAAKQVKTPDIMVSGSYTRTDYVMRMASMTPSDEDLKGEWSAGLSVVLPIWVKTNRAKVSKAREMLAVEKNMLKQEELILAKDASVYLAELKEAERQIALLDNVLIPKAKQTLELVSEMYTIGNSSILDFLDADKMLLDLQIQRVEQVKKRELYAAEIVICCLAKY